MTPLNRPLLRQTAQLRAPFRKSWGASARIPTKIKWPDAYDIIEVNAINTDEMSAMVGKADPDDVEIDTLVADWVGANKDRRSGWISK